MQACDAAVGRIRFPPDETVPLECLHDARHRRGTDVLGGGKLAERPRAPEDEHGQRREPSGTHAGRRILPPDVAQCMYRGRMETVGRFEVST